MLDPVQSKSDFWRYARFWCRHPALLSASMHRGHLVGLHSAKQEASQNSGLSQLSALTYRIMPHLEQRKPFVCQRSDRHVRPNKPMNSFSVGLSSGGPFTSNSAPNGLAEKPNFLDSPARKSRPDWNGCTPQVSATRPRSVDRRLGAPARSPPDQAQPH